MIPYHTLSYPTLPYTIWEAVAMRHRNGAAARHKGHRRQHRRCVHSEAHSCGTLRPLRHPSAAGRTSGGAQGAKGRPLWARCAHAPHASCPRSRRPPPGRARARARRAGAELPSCAPPRRAGRPLAPGTRATAASAAGCTAAARPRASSRPCTCAARPVCALGGGLFAGPATFSGSLIPNPNSSLARHGLQKSTAGCRSWPCACAALPQRPPQGRPHKPRTSGVVYRPGSELEIQRAKPGPQLERCHFLAWRALVSTPTRDSKASQQIRNSRHGARAPRGPRARRPGRSPGRARRGPSAARSGRSGSAPPAAGCPPAPRARPPPRLCGPRARRGPPPPAARRSPSNLVGALCHTGRSAACGCRARRAERSRPLSASRRALGDAADGDEGACSCACIPPTRKSSCDDIQRRGPLRLAQRRGWQQRAPPVKMPGASSRALSRCAWPCSRLTVCARARRGLSRGAPALWAPAWQRDLGPCKGLAGARLWADGRSPSCMRPSQTPSRAPECGGASHCTLQSAAARPRSSCVCPRLRHAGAMSSQISGATFRVSAGAPGT